MNFKIIGQHGCVSCAKARGLMFDYMMEFDYITVDNKPDLRELLKDLGFATVPVVFVQKGEGNFPTLIGGYEDLKNFLEFGSYLQG